MICGQLPQQGSGVLRSISASSGHPCKANVGMQHWSALWALILLSFVGVGRYAGTLAACGGGDCFLSPWQELSWLGWCWESQLSGAPNLCLCQRALLCWTCSVLYRQDASLHCAAEGREPVTFKS